MIIKMETIQLLRIPFSHYLMPVFFLHSFRLKISVGQMLSYNYFPNQFWLRTMRHFPLREVLTGKNGMKFCNEARLKSIEVGINGPLDVL